MEVSNDLETIRKCHRNFIASTCAQRRSYWLLDNEDSTVLVHYLEGMASRRMLTNADGVTLSKSASAVRRRKTSAAVGAAGGGKVVHESPTPQPDVPPTLDMQARPPGDIHVRLLHPSVLPLHAGSPCCLRLCKLIRGLHSCSPLFEIITVWSSANAT
jgi:hypothetical protein